MDPIIGKASTATINTTFSPRVRDLLLTISKIATVLRAILIRPIKVNIGESLQI